MRLRLLLGALVARVTTSLFAVGLLVLTADAVYVRAHSGYFVVALSHGVQRSLSTVLMYVAVLYHVRLGAV
jgi:hypothetical protein